MLLCEKVIVFMIFIFQDAKEAKTAAQKKERMRRTLELWKQGNWDQCVNEALQKETSLRMVTAQIIAKNEILNIDRKCLSE